MAQLISVVLFISIILYVDELDLKAKDFSLSTVIAINFN